MSNSPVSCPVTVAIDGPAGAGKSTVAKAAAKALGYTLVDTGAIYRAVALLAMEAGLNVSAPADDAAADSALGEIVDGLDIHFEMQGDTNKVTLGARDISEAIRSAEVSLAASAVSSRKVVRDGLLALQRHLAGHHNAVLEGRDIGTVVCPSAAVKIYLDAAPEERARRRCEEMQAKGEQAYYEEVLADIRRRDAQDMGRTHAPLRPAENAEILDSTKLNAKNVIDLIVRRARAAEHGG